MAQTLNKLMSDIDAARLEDLTRDIFRWHEQGVLEHESSVRHLAEEVASLTGTAGDDEVNNLQRAETLIVEEAARRWLGARKQPQWRDWATHATHNLDRWVLVDFGDAIESAKVIPNDNGGDYAHMLFDGEARNSTPRHLMSISDVTWLDPTRDNARQLMGAQGVILGRINNELGYRSHENLELQVRDGRLEFAFGSDPDLPTDALTLEAIGVVPEPSGWGGKS